MRFKYNPKPNSITLTKKEIIYTAILLNIIGISLLFPIFLKGFELYQVNDWDSVYCPIIESSGRVKQITSKGGRPHQIVPEGSQKVILYSYKVQLPNGSIASLGSYKLYEYAIPVYINKVTGEFRIIETNAYLINIVLFVLGIVILYYTNTKAFLLYQKTT